MEKERKKEKTTCCYSINIWSKTFGFRQRDRASTQPIPDNLIITDGCNGNSRSSCLSFSFSFTII
jgi:hypothetical protein